MLDAQAAAVHDDDDEGQLPGTDNAPASEESALPLRRSASGDDLTGEHVVPQTTSTVSGMDV